MGMFDLFIMPFLVFCTLSAVAQRSTWWFPDRVTLSNSPGNSNPNSPISFVNDTLWRVDLTKPFSITAWLNASDTKFWRAAISIESPDATSALLRIALPPDQMRFNVAWMKSAQSRGGAIDTTAVAPGPNVNFHFALVKDGNDITIYVNGVKRALHTLDSQIFNPQNKQIVLGRTKLDGNLLRSQWSGTIRDVTVWRGALSQERVQRDFNN